MPKDPEYTGAEQEVAQKPPARTPEAHNGEKATSQEPFWVLAAAIAGFYVFTFLAWPLLWRYLDAGERVGAMRRVPRDWGEMTDRLLENSEQLQSLGTEIQFLTQQVSNLELYIGFTGVLITILVVFFAFRTRNEAIAEAQKGVAEWQEKHEESIAEHLKKRVDRELEERRAELHRIIRATRLSEIMTSELEKSHRQLNEAFIKEKGDHKEETEDRDLECKLRRIELLDPDLRIFDDWQLLTASAVKKGDIATAVLSLEGAKKKANTKVEKAWALLADGSLLGLRKKALESIKKYDELIEGFKDEANKEPEVCNLIAMAMFNKAMTYEDIEEPQRENEAYDRLIKWGGQFARFSPEVLTLIAIARFNKALTLAQLNDHEEEISAYDSLIDWGLKVGRMAPGVWTQVARAMVNKAATYTQDMDPPKPDDAIEAYDRLIVWGKPHAPEDAELREQLARAYIGLADTYRLLGTPANLIKARGLLDEFFNWAKDYADDEYMPEAIKRAEDMKAELESTDD